MSTMNYSYPGTELEDFALAKHWKQYVAQNMAPFLHGRILEVGAGQGANISLLCNSKVSSWTALEPDRFLAAQIPNTVNGIKVCKFIGFIDQLPATSYFDAIIYFDVLEHIANDDEELQQASQHLAPNGHLIVLSPAYLYLYTEFDKSIGHVRRYTKKSLREALPTSLRIKEMKYLDAGGFFLSLANRIFLHQSQPSQGQILFWDTYVVPLSVFFDKFLFYSFGKSLLGIFSHI